MNAEQIQEARRLCDEATPGPWEYELDKQEMNIKPGCNPVIIIFHAVKAASMRLLRFNHENGEADARFIAASRTLLPAALDEIEAQQKENERLRGVIDRIWENRGKRQISTCADIACRGLKCGSPECKKAFMGHYLGSEKP